MSLDLSQFTIQRLVLHKVLPRQNREPVAPIYGNELVDIGLDGLVTLQGRIVKALGRDSKGIEMEINEVGQGSFFGASAPLLNAIDGEFVVSSQTLADMLNRAQSTRDLPGGALFVMTGMTGEAGSRFLAVVKAEMQDGFDLEESDEGLTVQYLNNLMLTPAQRFYKIGFLLELSYQQGEAATADNFVGFLYDHQMNAKETRPAAQYFYRSFLGFEQLETGKKLTRDFFLHTREFISGRDLDVDKKMDMYDALRVMLKADQELTISTADYAEHYLGFDDETSDDYLQFMESKGFPGHAISKDTSLIAPLLRRRKYKFTNEVTISGPAEHFNELVQIEQGEGDSTVVKIKGRLKAEE